MKTHEQFNFLDSTIKITDIFLFENTKIIEYY